VKSIVKQAFGVGNPEVRGPGFVVVVVFVVIAHRSSFGTAPGSGQGTKKARQKNDNAINHSTYLKDVTHQ
jgi:hypothetical protein